eukprot:COSAG02_NODE_1900_length_10458_cov_4.285838_1_plen_39_part_10
MYARERVSIDRDLRASSRITSPIFFKKNSYHYLLQTLQC